MKRLFISILVVLFILSGSAFAGVGDFVAKAKLSGSTDGKGIKVVATSTPGTAVHTATTGTTNFDEVWIWAYNGHTAAVVLTIEFGGVTDPDNTIVKTIPCDSGLYLVVPGLILQNAGAIKAFAGTTAVVVVYGYVNTLTSTP